MPVDSPREPTIYCEIDWLDDGTFSHAQSNLSDLAGGTSRLLAGTLSTQRGRDAARPLGQPAAATASIQVDNTDRLLSPEFAGSAIYQLIEPGRAYRIRMGAGTSVAYDAAIPYDDVVFYSGADTLSVVTGFLEEPEATSSVPLTATLSALGSLSALRDGQPVSTPLYQNVRTDQALGYLLDAAGWSSTNRVIAVSDTTLDLWWVDNADPFSAALELLASEGAPAAIYEDGAGRFVFENRNYRSTAVRSQTSRVTFSDGLSSPILYDAPIAYDAHVFYDAGSQLTHGSLQYASNFRDVKNQATYDIVRRSQQSLQKVWEYGTSLVLAPNESRLVTIALSDPVTNATAPVLATDYTVSVGALASTPTLESVNAQRLGIRFVAGAAGATVIGVTSNGPQLRAQPWTQVSAETIINSVDASASIARTKGVRALAISGRKEVNASFAQAVCNAAVTYYQDNRPVVTMPVENVDGQHLLYQLTTEISDRVAIISENLGMQTLTEFWVEQIEQRRQPAKLVTTFVCERALSTVAGGLWDSGLWDAALWAA